MHRRPKMPAANTGTTQEPRNESFDSNQPFEDDSSLSFMGANGTFRGLNPTSAQYSWKGWSEFHDRPHSHHHTSTTQGPHKNSNASSDDEPQQHSSEDEAEPEGHLPARSKDESLSFVWRSRDNRKGRHALLLRRGDEGQKRSYGTLEPTNSLPATLKGVYAIFTRFPYWDISWCVAVVYTLGSIIWIANGFTGVLPLVGKGSSAELQPANTWTAFAGASVFFLGSYLLFLEAVNANRSGCFGWAVERAITGVRLEAEVHPGDCNHHYHEREKRADEQREEENADYNNTDDVGHEAPCCSPSYQWQWWPSWYELRSHLLYEIGFLACAIQLFSGSLFWLTKFTILPGITEHFTRPLLNGLNWAPQIVGCIGFIVASALFMLETQQKWYIPAPHVLGWHVGFWKLIGCVGFLLSAVFGPIGQHGSQFAQNQSNISTFWASWMMLLGSLVQWYESLDKYPIIQEGNSRYSEWNEEFVEDSEKRRRRGEIDQDGEPNERTGLLEAQR